MTNFLTDQQVANCAAAGGWSGAALVTAIAIALAESAELNPATNQRQVNADAIGDVALQTAVWGPSVGPWQIRSLKAETGKGTVRDQVANMHPVTNAAHAHQIWAEAGGFTPWSTYLNQSYRLYVGRAQAVASGASTASGGHLDPQGNVVQDAIGGFQNAIGGVANGVADGAQAAVDGVKILAHAGAWLGNPHNITRVLWVAIGAGLVLAGAAAVSRPAVEPVIKVGTKVAELVPK